MGTVRVPPKCLPSITGTSIDDVYQKALQITAQINKNWMLGKPQVNLAAGYQNQLIWLWPEASLYFRQLSDTETGADKDIITWTAETQKL